MNLRLVRLGEAIRTELSRLISRDEELKELLVTITAVDISPDLRNSRVFVSHISDMIQEGSLIAGLNSRRVMWQAALSKRLPVKRTPRLEFLLDESLKRGDRVIEVLNELDIKLSPEEDQPTIEFDDGDPRK